MTIQRDLVAQPWPDDAPVQVRIGLHVGEVVEHGADLIGLAVHQAARVATTAHGGQIVVSDDLRSAVGPLAADITLRSLGEYRVRDLGVTELHQVCASGLAEVHPPLRAVTVRRTNLGPSATVLVGRGDLIERLLDELPQRRMITLTGVGGVGKTLLASELARCATERYEHGAFMVDLAPLGEDDDIAGAICAVLGVQPQGDRPVPDALNDWLQGRSILLFFDNAEHLTDRLGPLIQTLLERCAEVTALVTSRSPVGIAAETLRTVPPLSAGDGVELFRQRAATAGRMDALLTDPQACEELCRRVDGLPLAIEVVAARTRTMTPSELLRRLDHRLASAALPESGRVDRHRTLRATVDWSYRLLDHDEQVLFARLSTFSGSFDLEAVERVCAFGMLDVDSVVDLVDGLVASPSSRSTGRVQRPASGCSRCFASTPTNSSSRSIERRPEPVIVAGTPRSPSGRIVSFAVRTQERATRSFSSSGTTCAAPTLAPWPRVTARQPSGSRCTPGDTPSTTCESNTPSGSIGSWPPSHTQRAQRRHGGWPPIGTRTSPAMRSRPNVSRC